MDIATKIERGLKHRWDELHSKKTSILTYCEQYSRWTLPYVFPEDSSSTKDLELSVSSDSIGSKGVNHLSNKIVSTLFPAKSLFFRLVVDQEMRDLVEEALLQSGAEGEALRQQLEMQITAAEDELQKAEKRVEDRLNMIQFRPQAVNVVKQLIVTGNSLVYYPEDGGTVQVYNLRNFHVCRDIAGEVVEIMTRDQRAFETFSSAVQEKLKADARFKKMHKGDKQYEDATNVVIYTRILLESDGRYHVTQYADDVKLDTDGAVYTKNQLRWVPLVWNLVQGEDYGRGLVADYAGAFHAINTLSNALLNIAAIMGDIKIFVNPQSMIDVLRVEQAPSGSYHAGNPADIGTMQFNKITEAQFIQAMIERYERQIAAAFMLTQDLTRQAERVTAAEIQRDVDELETSNSGIYSRLAATWQYHTAVLALADTGFEGIGDGIEPRIITGMDSLSRAGEAYNMRLFLTDLGLLNGVPEDIRRAIKAPNFMKQISQYHQVPYEGWTFTQDEMDQRAQADLDRQQQLEETKQAGQVQAAAATEAVRSEG